MGLRVGDIVIYVGDFKCLQGIEATIVKVSEGIVNYGYWIAYDQDEFEARMKKTIFEHEDWPYYIRYQETSVNVPMGCYEWRPHRTLEVEELLLSDNEILRKEGVRRAKHRTALLEWEKKRGRMGSNEQVQRT